MFPKLEFQNNKEEYNKFIKIKGKFLYQQFYNVFLSKDDIVLYSDISSCMKYDKNLRDQLYIYLATFEEYLKTKIIDNYDISKDIISNKDDRNKHYKELVENFISRDPKSNESKLYYQFDLDFGNIINLIETKSLEDQKTINDYKVIKDLRNNVMHHSVLVLGKAKTYSEMITNQQLLIKQIKILVKYLPKDYQVGFTNTINSLPCDRTDYKIKVGE